MTPPLTLGPTLVITLTLFLHTHVQLPGGLSSVAMFGLGSGSGALPDPEDAEAQYQGQIWHII